MTIAAVASTAGGDTKEGSDMTWNYGGVTLSVGTLVVVEANGDTITDFVAGNCTKSAGTCTIGTITLDKAGHSATNCRAAIWSALVTGAGTLTMKVALGGANGNMGGEAYTGTFDSSRVEATNAAAGTTGLTPSSGNATSAAGALMIGGLCVDNGASVTLTPNTNFTSIHSQTDGTAHVVGDMIKRIVTTGTTDAASWTISPGPVTDTESLIVVYKESSSGTTITPAVGALTLAGTTASRSTDFGRIASVAALTLAGIAASVTQQLTITPTAGSLALSGTAAVVTQSNQTVTPTVGSLVFSGGSASVTQQVLLAPSAGALTFTGQQPIQQLTEPAPVTGALSIDGNAPAVTQDAARIPTAGSLTLTGITAVVSQVGNTPITPLVGDLSLVGGTATVIVTVPGTIIPLPGSLSITGLSPGVMASYSIAPIVGALSLTGIAPTVSTVASIAPAAGALTLSGIAPIVDQQLSIIPSVGSLTITGAAPRVNMAITISPSTGALVLSGNDAKILGFIVPGAGSLVLTGYAPANQGGGITGGGVEGSSVEGSGIHSVEGSSVEG